NEAVITTGNRTALHHSNQEIACIRWRRRDGREGLIRCQGKHVILLETDDPESLEQAQTIAASITFAEPPEDKARAMINNPLRRFNPLFSWRQVGDSPVGRSLAGLSSRQHRKRMG